MSGRGGAVAFNLAGLLLVLITAPLAWAALDYTRPAATPPAPSPVAPTYLPGPSSLLSVEPTATASPAPTLAYGSGKWAKLATLDKGLWGAAGVVLPDGRVLIIGGTMSDSSKAAVSAVKIVDPATGGWSVESDMADARAYVTAVLLRDGSVLVVGGSQGGRPIDTAERFFPDEGRSGAWQSAGKMHTPRTHATATLLRDGRVLVAGGGVDGAPDYTATASAEIYDPKTNGWSNLPDMSRPRALAIAERLPSGSVLVAGGADIYRGQGNVTATAEIFDPTTGKWHAVAPMGAPRYAFASAPLLGGRVLVAGGWTYTANTDPSLASAEIYDEASSTWTTVGPMRIGRGQFSLAALADGRVLAVGGVSPAYGILASCDLYDPGTRTWSPTGDLPQAVMWGVLKPLGDGRALAVGGATSTHGTGQSPMVAIYSAPAPSK